MEREEAFLTEKVLLFGFGSLLFCEGLMIRLTCHRVTDDAAKATVHEDAGNPQDSVLTVTVYLLLQHLHLFKSSAELHQCVISV